PPSGNSPPALHDALPIVEAPERTVSLVVSGDGYTIGQLGVEDFVVYPDCSSVRSSGTKTLQLRVRCINSAVAGNISVSIADPNRSEEHTSELQSRFELVC